MELSILQSNGIEALPQFLTSLAIGLLIGLERERNPSAKAGLRTFALVAVFGTLSALLSTKLGTPWLLIGGLLGVAGMIVAAYFNTPNQENDPGTTTVIALLLSYGLGAIIWLGLAKLAVMLAIGITALLYLKPELRGFSQKLTRHDLLAVLQFSVLTFIILPILPDQSYGPYGAVNPHQAWLMVVLISGISLAGYAALHAVGTRYGAPLLGFFGGLASSTATTMIYAKHGKNTPLMLNLAASVIVIASIVVIVRLMAVSAVLAYGTLPGLFPVLSGGLILGLMVVLYNRRKMRDTTDLQIPATSNPAELHSALSFGLLYVVVLLVTAWMKDIAGSQGLYMVALLSGLTDVDAITLSSLRLFKLGQLTEYQTVTAIALAFVANLAFKFGMVYFIGGRELAKRIVGGFAAIACGILLGWFAL
ncbi:MAG: magnesium transporter MgtC [Gallionellales bacterium CG_4_10_14_3_um_filter_54_96]|nr:MAG: magnesium transporter MgtC [Gallionellaceae bacterium CG1_02_56_997]PIV14488.1 MAG: magnesium transporter MgtC [Gallionellales bacterium CG03_land_8_20_14_0_80_55_15]PIV91366.1 MAG: magnesium transporter MgtC [Gallionellales bacterium CG17_big_fil_post_rev_8_21_14_2_50_54_146]PIX05400.1 MAG: magnesium transporter MgtC [Gallionellales bacterium CG_4_8_14_3_um_filter_54_18]PIY06526.1 MAG: magnesium transporter MgtC [Gallionellales bacterium CG_4_10_14_3_um_filter_54_96]PJC04659.1 MAG: ma